jgi:transposase
MKKEILKYDKQFKQSVLSLLETGEISSIEECRRKFNIGGSMTVQKWMKQLSREDLLPKLRIRHMKDEIETLKDSDPKLYDAVKKTIAA